MKEFEQKNNFLRENFDPFNCFDFYRFIFPPGSFERKGKFEDKKANGIALTISKNNQGRHTIITDGLEQLNGLQKKDFVAISPISYCGHSPKANNARWLYALALDIDYVTLRGIKYLLKLSRVEFLPNPTFLVNSSHGIHLYYVFENPLPMYPGTQQELKKLKAELIERAWNVSERAEAMETLGLVQAFRMVGSKTKFNNGSKVSAFKTGEKVTLEYLNSFVSEKNQAINFDYKSRYSLEEAKQKFPDWYERVILRKEQPGRWTVKRDLYDWFKRQIAINATIGHRYFCCLALCIFANKCRIEENELIKDLIYFQKELNDLSEDGSEPFEREEALKTLTAFNDSYTRYPRETLEKITAISMPANKRNFRKQKEHLEIARAIQEISDKQKGVSWRDNNGRKKGSIDFKKLKKVKNYFLKNPDANNSQAERDLKISRPTIIKYKNLLSKQTIN